MILSRPITLVHFQLLYQLLNSARRDKSLTGEQRCKMEVVAIPRLILESVEKGRLMLRSKRRLEGKAIPTTEQRGAVTAFISRRAIFLLCYRVHQYLPEPGVVEKYLDLPNLSIVHQFLAVGKLSAELRAQLSMKNLCVPSRFLTITTALAHGDIDGSITHYSVTLVRHAPAPPLDSTVKMRSLRSL